MLSSIYSSAAKKTCRLTQRIMSRRFWIKMREVYLCQFNHLDASYSKDRENVKAVLDLEKYLQSLGLLKQTTGWKETAANLQVQGDAAGSAPRTNARSMTENLRLSKKTITLLTLGLKDESQPLAGAAGPLMNLKTSLHWPFGSGH